ncbi:unnamed protein product [Staurois parvus]|uniref:Uncharacterized protein n=1 Tax=Staurois parvus TaxID=386267 RepID=A0ABN9DXK2_9NEOB|nr:unnamed protein product [Staurois parvus]
MGEVRVLQNLWAANRDLQAHLDTRGSTGLCANSWWLRDNTCAWHRTNLYCTYGTRQVILQCWFVKDQDVLDRWCSPVHQKVAQH